MMNRLPATIAQYANDVHARSNLTRRERLVGWILAILCLASVFGLAAADAFGSPQLITGMVSAVGNYRGTEAAVISVALTGDLEGHTVANYTVAARAALSKTHVTFHVGDTVTFTREGATPNINGFAKVHYLDDKGKDHTELHVVLN